MSVQPKGPWIIRVAVQLFTALFGLLIFWLLGFVLADLRNAEGPDYATIEREHVDAALVARSNQQTKELEVLDRKIADRQEARTVVAETSRNLQQTIDQLIELERLGIEKGVTFSEENQGRFDDSLALFLDNQRKAQDASREIVELVATKQALEQAKREVDATIEAQRVPARKAYDHARERHRLRQATFQLAFLVPLLGVAGWLFRRRRRSRYFPLVVAFGGAVLFQIFAVIHGYFPSRYYKYILTLSLLAVVTRLLIGLIRTVHEPPLAQRLSRYREGYERFLCPVCEYPIRTGPRQFLFWTRRTVGKVVVGPTAADASLTVYACPACGTSLFEPCASCQTVRHTLLPHCEHCGAEGSLDAARDAPPTGS